MKIKKVKKSKKLRGTNSHAHGSRKKWKGSGHRGGIGMSGTGKRADHKKTLINKLYGNKYFGRQGITSRGTEKRRDKRINLEQIQRNLDSLLKKYGKGNELILKNYKILGTGKLKQALTINAKEFSKSAEEKIKKSGGKCIKPEIKEIKKEVKENKKVEKKSSISPQKEISAEDGKAKEVKSKEEKAKQKSDSKEKIKKPSISP